MFALSRQVNRAFLHHLHRRKQTESSMSTPQSSKAKPLNYKQHKKSFMSSPQVQETEDPVLERTFRGHNGTVTSVCFCPTMKKIGSSSMDASIMLWSFKPQLRAFKYIGHEVCSPFTQQHSNLTYSIERARCNECSVFTIW